MQGFVAQKLNDFETGKISRRRLIETLTLAATTAYAADSAQAQADPALKAQLINHISYTCPNFKQAGEWYAKVFNLDLIGETRRDIVAVFGKKGEQPYNVTARDVPHSHLVIRTRDTAPAQPKGEARPRPAPRAVIDHICYTVADFNQARAKAELTALGVKNIREAGTRSLHFDDAFGYDVQIAGLESHALTDG